MKSFINFIYQESAVCQISFPFMVNIYRKTQHLLKSKSEKLIYTYTYIRNVFGGIFNEIFIINLLQYEMYLDVSIGIYFGFNLELLSAGIKVCSFKRKGSGNFYVMLKSRPLHRNIKSN